MKCNYFSKLENIGFIEIRITGSKGSFELSPENYDIREVIAMLQNAENLLFPGSKKDRSIISYKIEEGSVRHILKTSIQYIIGFNAILGQIVQRQNIDFLDHKTAIAFESIQELAVKQDYSINIKTSVEHSNKVDINNTTRFVRTETIWIDAEFYFYGKITSAGGKNFAKINLSTEEFGVIGIQTSVDFLEHYDENILYKNFGIRATGKQNSETGDIDTTALQFLELIDYQPKYDKQYLQLLRDKAKKTWLHNINPDAWLREIRGGPDV